MHQANLSFPFQVMEGNALLHVVFVQISVHFANPEKLHRQPRKPIFLPEMPKSA